MLELFIYDRSSHITKYYGAINTSKADEKRPKMNEILQVITHYIKLSEEAEDPERKESYEFIVNYLTQEYLIGDLT